VDLAVLSPGPEPCQWGLTNGQKTDGLLLGFEACLNLLQKSTYPRPDVWVHSYCSTGEASEILSKCPFGRCNIGRAIHQFLCSDAAGRL
jgi:hypothetical protein